MDGIKSLLRFWSDVWTNVEAAHIQVQINVAC